MQQYYPDIEYDEETRRINRICKFAGVLVAVALVVAAGYGISTIDLRAGPEVANDTEGSLRCVHLNQDGLRFSAALDPREEQRIATGSSCSVFNRTGDYVACLRIPNGTSKDERLLASSADRSVKAESCAYPR